jgi:hypothetical protein
MVTSAQVTTPGTRRLAIPRTAVILAVVVVVAIALNTVVSMLVMQVGANPAFAPLTLPVYGAFTLIGVLVGWAGWLFVGRRAARPRRTLSILVPVVALASFLPDILLLVTRFIPHTSGIAVAGLMTMHVIVVALAVPGYALASRPR